MFTEGKMLQDYLGFAGIVAQLRGDDLIREAPVEEFFPALWVQEEDLSRAQEILAQWEAGTPPGDWTCPCGEVNESSFGSCWKCGTLRLTADAPLS